MRKVQDKTRVAILTLRRYSSTGTRHGTARSCSTVRSCSEARYV
jgi:hypothetical protein